MKIEDVQNKKLEFEFKLYKFEYLIYIKIK
jgi:hypothetical protein